MTKKKLITYFYLILFTLMIIGLLAQLSLYSPESLAKTNNYFTYFKKHIIILVLFSVFLIFKANWIKILRECYILIYGLGFVLLVAVLYMGLTINGAKRWLKIGILFQPSEFSKICLVIFIAGIINLLSFLLKQKPKIIERINIGKRITEFEKKLVLNKNDTIKLYFFWIIVFATGFYFFLIYKSSSLFQGFQILLICFCMLSFSHFFPTKLLLFLMGIGSVAIYYGITRTAYRFNRFSDHTHSNYATNLISSGGIFGKGYGNGLGREFFLPEVQNDYIFAGISEEIGLIFSVILILIFIIYIILMFYISVNAKTLFERMLGYGISIMITNQIVLHLIINVGFISTGVTLPFLSSGGTSLITILFSMTIMQSILFGIDDKKLKGDIK